MIRLLLAICLVFTLIPVTFAEEKEQDSPPVLATTTGQFVVYRNGKRDHRAELLLMQRASQYKKPSYGSYAAESFKREFDYRAKRKIDAEIDRVLDRIF